MSIVTRVHYVVATLIFSGLSLFSPLTHAASYGGIALGATRVIYPQGSDQVSLPVNNTDSKSVFLIQSWVENSDSKKSSDFVVTPPLFVIKPQKENTLRIMYMGPNNLPTDRESLYWMNVKAIPSANKDIKDKNTLQIAVLSRIKLFVRPKDLPMKSVDAPAKLRFHQSGDSLTIKNPTPYYLTLVQLHAGLTTLPATMVPPMGQSTVKLPQGSSGGITFQTVNDFGANTPKQTAVMD
ncbi:fimbria/pilus periplasmic chaperone [Salmonella enterica]|nr:fimbrial chaperone protein FimC [Salmonella enterica]EBS8342132.1 fimbria/pilus periplasmic chaperone [Salmonella enterica]EBS8683859.1 fimbria/pilus periplasmic chaperone [Salmonella enterica]EBT3582818.1 fimbria/pilus periplasmic chaperone [Salmonella enterica]EBT5382280.1 fimbria/pilus periplasmic chaperone [Salmonella enterica]